MQQHYQKPAEIASDMGGHDDKLDERLSMVLELLETSPLNQINTVLDIGVGKGQLAKWFAEKGKKVTGTGLEIESYGLDPQGFFAKYGIEVVDCRIEEMPFRDESFDAIVMSHILEHVPNVGLALEEVRRILTDDGYLFIFVPPHEDFVRAGHIAMGWNIGQLMYLLLLNGFNVKEGRFIEYGYNVCAFVQKSNHQLPTLRGDRGDIYLLAQNGFLPLPIVSQNPIGDEFNGKIRAVNWPNAEQLLNSKPLSTKNRFLYVLAWFIPASLKKKLGSMFVIFGDLLHEQSGHKGNINPSSFRGN
jgi:ubiquinone/menaquinone biosynthesis C-methylase UbiE